MSFAHNCPLTREALAFLARGGEMEGEQLCRCGHTRELHENGTDWCDASNLILESFHENCLCGEFRPQPNPLTPHDFVP